MLNSVFLQYISNGLVFNHKLVCSAKATSVVLNLFSTTPPLSNCRLFQVQCQIRLFGALRHNFSRASIFSIKTNVT